MSNDSLLSMLSNLGNNNPITNAAKYWSADNAQFEQTNPTLLARMGRSINPLSSFGSVMGAMHDGASKGSFPEMGIAAVQAYPAFALMRKGFLAKQAAPSLNATLKALGAGALGSSAVDEAQTKSR